MLIHSIDSAVVALSFLKSPEMSTDYVYKNVTVTSSRESQAQMLHVSNYDQTKTHRYFKSGIGTGVILFKPFLH